MFIAEDSKIEASHCDSGSISTAAEAAEGGWRQTEGGHDWAARARHAGLSQSCHALALVFLRDGLSCPAEGVEIKGWMWRGENS